MQDDKDTQIVDVSQSIDEDAVSAMIGTVVAGKYKVERRLARGGMGVVYLAKHITLERPVVFKVLSYHLADDQRAHSRFEREARGLSVLDHPNVVTVHDFGVENGLTYIVMEYIHGENLSQRIRRLGRLTYDELLPICIQTIDAIAAAHDKSIVHRDIKPSNVMVTERGSRENVVKVLDFGLAKLATSSVDITQGNLVGTVSYLAPEVIKGADATPASDVYSLGVMFYYLLCGEKPFTGSDDMSVLYQHVNEEPMWLGDRIPPGEAPQEFFEFLHHCMEKDPKKRPQSATALRGMLADMVSLPSISAFSMDSSLQLPRYAPSESEDRPRRDTSPSGVAMKSIGELGAQRSSEMSFSRSMISMERPRARTRVAVIAFTVVSVGLVVLAFAFKSQQSGEADVPPPPAEQPTVQAAPTAAPVVRPTLLIVNTTPPGDVTVNGKARGTSPLEVEVKPGRHVVLVSKQGYKPWTSTVEVNKGERRTLDVYLAERSSAKEAVEKTTTAPSEPVAPPPRPTPVRVAKPAPEPPQTNDRVDEDPVETEAEKAAEKAAEKPVEQPSKSGLLSAEEKKSGLLPVGD